MLGLLQRFNVYFVRQGKRMLYSQVYTSRCAEEVKLRFSDLIQHRADSVHVIECDVVHDEVLVDEDLF